jgi:wyosine [tRNA(Phe)-imidazoG37] synthetase (radical SAM superfamily)
LPSSPDRPAPTPVPEAVARVDGTLVKETRSYCPVCLRVVDASVRVVEELVWIYRTCPEHGPSQGLLERDAVFYRAVRNMHPERRLKAHSIVIPVTHRCNLDCRLCFVPKRDREDLSLDALKRILDGLDVIWVAFSGGEPTLRADLPELITHGRRTGKSVLLNSNGIRLADRDYVRTLADAGLETVVLAFNGFDDAVYRVMNGRPLLDLKLRALDALARYGVSVILSPTFMRGVNEDIRPLLRLCLEYAPQIIELRTRNAARIGRHEAFEPLVLSEMFRNLATALDTPRENLLGSLDRDRFYHSINQWIMEAAFFARGAEANRLARWSPGAYNGLYHYERPPQGELESGLRQEFGEGVSTRKLWEHFKFLHIVMWYWPDAYTVDLEEIEAHGVMHLYDNRIPLNFYEAILRAYRL